MIFRLTYCNRFGDKARIDIQTPGASTVMEVEGTETPFNLQYKNDKSDKSGNFRTSSAEINIYETPEFNIDTLKTSSETDIKVDYYINEVKKWTGYVIPDFFSREIGGSGVVSMVASDRISTLKGVTLGELPEHISIRELAVRCLANTGLDLPLKTMADFLAGQFGFNDFFRSKILSQRLIDTKGRSISCYDILGSILIASNSLLIQRDAEWYIINKFQHETGIGNLYSTDNTSTEWESEVYNFNEVTKGAMRSIIPVAASVGIFHEHGGGRLHPVNYDFSKGISGWTPVNGFQYEIGNKEITGFEIKDGYTFPVYGDAAKLNYILSVKNKFPFFLDAPSVTMETYPYIENTIDVISTSDEKVDISIDFSCTGSPGTIFYYAIIAEKGSERYALNKDGGFEKYDSGKIKFIHRYINGEPSLSLEALTKNQQKNATFEVEGVKGYKLKIRVYGAGSNIRQIGAAAINYISVRFSNNSETAKGNIYKREQGSGFTKTHDIDTSIIGGYITGGLNGYFYDYPIDDTSSLFDQYDNADLRSPNWTSPGDDEERPLLLHSVRQKARMFSVAHDLISGEIDMVHFDPLAIFQDCKGKKYTVVSADVDFLNSVVKVDIEEIAFQSLPVRDFIYSYFGEGESGISSVGGIASGTGGGAGGGMTSEQLAILNNLAEWWKIDEDGNLYTELNVYSMLEVSAYGKGFGGLVIPPFEITDPAAGQALQFNGTHWVNVPWPGGGGGGSTVSWGTTLNGYSPLTVEGLAKTVALSGHAHAASDITSGVFATARLGGGTPSASNFLRGDGTWATPAGATYSAGNGLTLSGTVFSLPVTIVGTGNVVEDVLQNSSGITVYKTTLASTIYSGSTSIILSGTSFQRAALTGDVTSPQNSNALTLANSGVTAGTYNNVATQVRPFTVDAKGRITAIGTAVTIAPAWDNVTGKPSTFAPSVHTHAWGEITSKPTTFTPSAHTHAWGEVTGKPTTLSGYGISTSDTLFDSRYLRLTGGTLTGDLHTPTVQIFGDSNGIRFTKDGSSPYWVWINYENRLGIGNGATAASMMIDNAGNVRMPSLLDVGGEIKSAINITSPKFSLSTGWTFEPSGSEMQFKYNGILKHRLLSDGSFVAVGEITAYGAASGGASAFLPLAGGTMTGDLLIGTYLGATNLALNLRGNAFKYNTYDVLHKGNIGSAQIDIISLGNGWTIEQTAASLTIKRNGVVKYTVNA